MAENPGHSISQRFALHRQRHPETAAHRLRNGPSSRGPLPVRGRPLFELGDPYFEADEVLGKFAGCAQLHQFFNTWPIIPSLSLRYLLCALCGYGVKIVHDNVLS